MLNKQFMYMLLQMPAKGAKGLVIAAVTLTGRSYPYLIGYFDQTFNSNIHLIFNFGHLFATASIIKKNTWTSQHLRKLTMVL